MRQEVLENLLLLVLDLLTACTDGDERLAPLGDDLIPTLLGYLDEAEDEMLLRVLRGDAVYHYLLFSLPGAGALRARRTARRRRRRAARAWDRIVAHLYREHGWRERPRRRAGLLAHGGSELEIVRGHGRDRGVRRSAGRRRAHVRVAAAAARRAARPAAVAAVITRRDPPRGRVPEMSWCPRGDLNPHTHKGH